MGESLHIAVIVSFVVVFITAMIKNWELTSIFFGIALLLHGCNLLAGAS